VIAMTGKNCVAIASDLRLGQQAVGLSADFEKVSFVQGRRLCRARFASKGRGVRSLFECSAVCGGSDRGDRLWVRF
jgi:hypothetical protein